MPHFFNQDNNFTDEMIKRNNSEIYAITEYLFQNGEHQKNNSSKYIGDKTNGEKLFQAVGCMGCHSLDNNVVSPNRTYSGNGISYPLQGNINFKT